MKHKKGDTMKFVEFHKKSDGSVLIVNADKIVAFDALSDGGTRLVFDEVFAYQVAESVQEVVLKVVGCRKA